MQGELRKTQSILLEHQREDYNKSMIEVNAAVVDHVEQGRWRNNSDSSEDELEETETEVDPESLPN